MYKKQTLSAGVAVEFYEESDFFRLIEAEQSDVTIIFYGGGRELARAENVGAGYAEQFSIPFDRAYIQSTAGGAVTFLTRRGNKVTYDPIGAVTLAGAVTIAGHQGAFVNASATVTNASGQLLAANAERRYLLIQNKDSTGVIYVTLDGQTATTVIGVKIASGGSLELQGYVPSGAIKAIGSIASNANIVVVEG